MGYSIEAATADCYDGTTCLIDKFGIKDDKQLSFIEGQITFAKGSELEKILSKVILILNIINLFITAKERRKSVAPFSVSKYNTVN